jgi:hypothetical protein
MAFDAASLLSDLFPEQPPARASAAPAEPKAARRAPPPAPTTKRPARPANRLPNALPTLPIAEWLSEWRRSPQIVPPPEPCWWCGGSLFWTPKGGPPFICGGCHPPMPPSRVGQWVQVVPTEDGPQVVRLGNPPSTP